MRNRIIISILLILVIGYGIIKALPLIKGPRISISELSTDPAGVTTLAGTAIHTEKLSLNGGVLLISDSGDFQTHLTLPRGGVILTLTATDRFGRSQTIERPVVTP